MAGIEDVEDVDAVVVGANTRGLITTYLLSCLGYRAVLLERSGHVGGVDGCFTTPGGTHFDYGLHVLDDMRSELATRLFTHVVGGRVHRVTLARAIALRGHVMPYAPAPAEMPDELRRMLPGDDLVDDLGDELPTRERLARCYGREFTDFMFDEVLPSYPSEVRHRELGVDESRLMVNVYPWLFPRATRHARPGDESWTYHDRLRSGFAQDILYPKDGCFAAFAEGFVRAFDRERIEVVTGAEDLRLEIEPGTHTATSVTARGRRFRATHYFWAASWPALCGILDLPCQPAAADRVLLGSFRLDRAAHCDYHEVLVGDPAHRINRVYFPARFRGSDDPLMQIEFAVPRAEEPPLDPAHWRQSWIESVRQLGLLDASHRVEEFDFRSFPVTYNGFGVEGAALREADATLLRGDSNIRPVTPSVANLNLNRHVPRDVAYVASVLAASPASLARPERAPAARYVADPERSPYVGTERYDAPKEDVVTIGRKLEALLGGDRDVRVADLGCANGELLHHLHRKFPRWSLHGFDITPEFIETARGFAGLRGVHLEVRDLFDVEGEFDVVIASCVLSIFPDPQEPLAKMLALCREGGFVLATGLFNPHDIDVRVELRDNTHAATRGRWRTEYGRPSQRSIREAFGRSVRSIEFEPCPFGVDLPPRADDPIRVWTFKDEHGARILTNGTGQILNQVLLTMQK